MGEEGIRVRNALRELEVLKLLIKSRRAGAVLVPLPAVEAKGLPDRNAVRLALCMLLGVGGGRNGNLRGVRGREMRRGKGASVLPYLPEMQLNHLESRRRTPRGICRLQ